MRNKLILILGMLLSLGLVWGQGLETFENHNLSGSAYADGSYTGDNGITWNYVHCRDQDTYSIMDKGIILRSLGKESKVFSEPISGGIGDFSVKMKKAYTGATARQLALYINNNHIVDSQTFGGASGEDSDTYYFIVNNINISGNVVIEVRNIKGTGTNYSQCVIDDLTWTGYGGSSPTITVSPATLTGFTYTYGSGSSSIQSLTVSGTNLTDDVMLSIDDYYEISETQDDEDFDDEGLILDIESGALPETTIYVRLKAGLGINTYSGTITIESTGADDKTVTCSGSVTGPPPPDAPVANNATLIGGTSFTANWNAVTGATGYYLDLYQKTENGNATDLIISEYVEGTSNNKYIEIFNGTGALVELSDYKLELYNNGNLNPNQSIQLSGTLANGAVKVYKNSIADLTLPTGVTADDNAACNFNGDDVVAIRKISTDSHVDIFGVLGHKPIANSDKGYWEAANGNKTQDKTLVRKPGVAQGITVSPTGYENGDKTAFETLGTEWTMYDVDIVSNLGSHTFTGEGYSYVTGFENKDVGDVTSFQVTGLYPEETYYYVVRAYDNYGQTSASSNEIEVSTVLYDFPDGEVVDYEDGNSYWMIDGNANIAVGVDIPPIPNGNFTLSSSIVLELFVSGAFDLIIETEANWGAYYLNGSWHKEENEGGLIEFENISVSKAPYLPIILGDQDPTLPVELSAFNVALNSRNQAVLTWVSETETGMIGYYIYRNGSEDLDSALRISELIPATNTSQQQVYIFTDKELDGAGTYYYWLQTNDMDGTIGYYGPIYLLMENDLNDSQTAPLLTRLGSIYPNPFNPDTTISYSLAGAEEIELRIYNTRGQLVRTLEKGSRNAGNYRLIWDAKDDNDRTVSSGIYFIRLNAGNKSFMKKAILLK